MMKNRAYPSMKIITAPQPMRGARRPGMLELNSSAMRSKTTLAKIILPGVILSPCRQKNRNIALNGARLDLGLLGSTVFVLPLYLTQ